MNDLIDRRAAIDAVKNTDVVVLYHDTEPVEEAIEEAIEATTRSITTGIEGLPSAQPEARPIDYQDCSNAMLKMWMDNVVTDGEYNRIMDKLNEHEKKKGVLNEGQKNERYNQQTGGD